MPAIFVHGVTVREDRYADLLKKVQSGLTDQRSDLAISGFYWGHLATSATFTGATIPGFEEGIRAITSRIPYPANVELDALLLEDPYLELYLIRDREDFDPAGAGFTPLPPGVEARNALLFQKRPTVHHALETDKQLADAVGPLRVASNRYAEVVDNAFKLASKANRNLGIPDLIDSLSRTLTAALFKEVSALADTPRQALGLDTSFAWNAVEERVEELLEQELGGQRGMIGDALKEVGLSSMTYILRNGLRQRIMGSFSVFLGDVFVYLSKRDAILANLSEEVTNARRLTPGPLWLVGHSLGGIICFDLILRGQHEVERLATVGSQVGLFGELGALELPALVAPDKHPLPNGLQRWINIYDPNDMLSFLAEPLFHGVQDIPFDSDAPFPASHSEYWNHSRVYTAICA